MAYEFVMLLIAQMVALAGQLIHRSSTVRAHQTHERPVSHVRHNCVHQMSRGGGGVGGSSNECCGIYKHVSLTAEANGDYGTFSGQYLMGAK